MALSLEGQTETVMGVLPSGLAPWINGHHWEGPVPPLRGNHSVSDGICKNFILQDNDRPLSVRLPDLPMLRRPLASTTLLFQEHLVFLFSHLPAIQTTCPVSSSSGGSVRSPAHLTNRCLPE